MEGQFNKLNLAEAVTESESFGLEKTLKIQVQP